ncbi:MAG: hypothetical protein ACR2OR_00680 [Hyphomicrobiales bacterium]
MNGQTTSSPASEPGPEKIEILDIDDDAPRPAVKKHDVLPVSKNENSEQIPAQAGKTGTAEKAERPSGQRPINRGTDISGPFVATIFISSIAGLGFAGVEMVRSNISQQSAVVFICAWALIASVLLTLSYLAARHRKIAGFFSRSGMHMLCAAVTFSSITIAAIMLAFMYRPAVGSIVQKTVETETALPEEKDSSELLSSFENLKLKAPRYSEHFYTRPTPEGNPPFRRTAPVLEEPAVAPVDSVLMQEVQKQLAAKIEPTAAKPDRKVKAENPAPKKTMKKKKKKKRKVVSKRKKTKKPAKKRRVAAVTRKPAQQVVKTTPLVITNKSDELIDKNQPDCMGMKSVRSAECSDQR